MVPNIHINNIESHMILTAAILTRLGYIHHTHCGSSDTCYFYPLYTLILFISSSSRLTKKNFETRNPFSVEKCRPPRMREFSYRPIQACWVIGLLFCCFHRKQRHIQVEPVSMVDHGHMGVEYKGTRMETYFRFLFLFNNFFLCLNRKIPQSALLTAAQTHYQQLLQLRPRKSFKTMTRQ